MCRTSGARVVYVDPFPGLRACDEISGALRCRPPGPMARRERRAYRVVCKERTTQPAGLRAAARRGAAAGGHLLRCRSSTMAPHRLRRGALHLPARRSRRSASLISSQALTAGAIHYQPFGPHSPSVTSGLIPHWSAGRLWSGQTDQTRRLREGPYGTRPTTSPGRFLIRRTKSRHSQRGEARSAGST